MGPNTVIPVRGEFDTSAASELCKRLAQMDSGASAVIDFTEARELNVVALTVLMNGIGEIRSRVSLWGLSQHYNRVLRYLGLPAAGAGSREYASSPPEAATGR